MHRSPTLVRRAALLGAAALAFSACDGSDGDTSDTTEAAPETTTAATTTPATTAPTTTETPEATATTTPATREPGTTDPGPTTPPTTVPAPATTEGVPGDPIDDGPELAQFCFDSEQVYVFNQVVNVLTEPTPEQAEAALSILAFTIDAAIESAPEGMAAEPQQLADIIARIDAGFASFDYDVDAFAGSPEAAAINEVFAEYEDVVGRLTAFIDAECTTAADVLDSQAVKLAPMVDELRDLPLQPIANQAGDIRLFVPVDWPEWIGSTEVEDVTFLEASSDIEEFENTWNVPGVLATAAYVGDGRASPGELLDSSSAGPDCTLDSTEPYADDVYIGELHLLSDCAGVGTDAAVLAATDIATTSVEITLEFQFPGGSDRELLDQMLATFAAGA